MNFKNLLLVILVSTTSCYTLQANQFWYIERYTEFEKSIIEANPHNNELNDILKQLDPKNPQDYEKIAKALEIIRHKYLEFNNSIHNGYDAVPRRTMGWLFYETKIEILEKFLSPANT